MKSLLTFKKMKGEKVEPNHPLEKPSRGYSKNVLTPVTLSGVVVPWDKEVSATRSSEYKLVCTSGLEYFLVANDEWRSVLSWYCWEEVKIVGLLNTADLTLIPQRVFPKGPKGEKENVIDLALWRSREAIKKITKNVSDLVLVPAAVLAVAGFYTPLPHLSTITKQQDELAPPPP
ncbi:MAG: hypothetical protein AB7N80_06880 [Bdellovibrionales bacterium]